MGLSVLLFPLAAGKILWLFLSPALCEVVSENSCLIPLEIPGLYLLTSTHKVRSCRCQAPAGSLGTSLLAVQKVPFPSVGRFARRPSCSGVDQEGSSLSATQRSVGRAQHTLFPARFGSREAQN